jgi:hypothetical protein
MQWFIDHSKFRSNSFYIGAGSYSGTPAGPLIQKVYEGKLKYLAASVWSLNSDLYIYNAMFIPTEINLRTHHISNVNLMIYMIT